MMLVDVLFGLVQNLQRDGEKNVHFLHGMEMFILTFKIIVYG
jgi:hypothetical protein